jgi:hypothetical protein
MGIPGVLVEPFGSVFDNRIPASHPLSVAGAQITLGPPKDHHSYQYHYSNANHRYQNGENTNHVVIIGFLGTFFNYLPNILPNIPLNFRISPVFGGTFRLNRA